MDDRIRVIRGLQVGSNACFGRKSEQQACPDIHRQLIFERRGLERLANVLSRGAQREHVVDAVQEPDITGEARSRIIT